MLAFLVIFSYIRLMTDTAKKPKYFRTVSGFNGVTLRKMIAFVFEVDPINYEYKDEEATFVFWIKEEAIRSEGAQRWVKKFQDDLRIIIIGV